MKVKVEVKGMEDVKKAVADLFLRRNEIQKEVSESAFNIQRKAKDSLRAFGAIDTGHARATTIAEFAKDGFESEIGTVAPYGIYIEFGTRPHFPPPDALEAWARHHGFKSAWPICKAIAKRGLRARPYLMPAYDEVAPGFHERLAQIFKREK
jgi:hypothetical protein